MDKFYTSHPHFKVIIGYWNNTDQLATCAFLLVFHSNYGHVSYRFCDNG